MLLARACSLVHNSDILNKRQHVLVYAFQRFRWIEIMTRQSLRTLALSFVLLASTGLVANDPLTVVTHTLTVQEKLELLETIEITSEKELQPIRDEDKDVEIEEILEEISQLESELVSNE